MVMYREISPIYRFEDRTDGSLLKVSAPRTAEGVIVSIKYLGKLNYLMLDDKEALRFAEAVLKTAGSKAMVVPLSKDEVRVDRFGNLCCGERKVSEGITLEQLRVAVSNLATIVSFIEKNQGVEDRLKAEREEVAELLGIDMPKAGDIEGLRALDEIVKRRKGL